MNPNWVQLIRDCWDQQWEEQRRLWNVAHDKWILIRMAAPERIRVLQKQMGGWYVSMQMDVFDLLIMQVVTNVSRMHSVSVDQIIEVVRGSELKQEVSS